MARTARKEVNRQRILEAATELLIHEGVENVTMRKVAGRVNYSPMALYAYFPAKPHLLRAVAEGLFAELEQHMRTHAGETPEGRERLRVMLRAYIDFGIRHPREYRVLFQTPWEAQDGGELTAGTEDGGVAAEPMEPTASTDVAGPGDAPAEAAEGAPSSIALMALEALSNQKRRLPEAPVVSESEVPPLAAESMPGAAVLRLLAEGVSGMLPRRIRTQGVAERTAMILWAGVHGMTSLVLEMPGLPLEARGVPSEMVESLLVGCEARLAHVGR